MSERQTPPSFGFLSGKADPLPASPNRRFFAYGDPEDQAALPSADLARQWAGSGLADRLQAMHQQLMTLAASARVAELQMRAVSACLSSEQSPETRLEISVSAADFETACVLIELMQHENPAFTLDDCVSEIFTTGLATLAYRLIP